METIRGRKSLEIDAQELARKLAGYARIHLDLGTGDGRYVQTLAGEAADRFVIGIDACREHLREHSRRRLRNMLFVIASAQELPAELHRLVQQVTVNFPWGSLLEGLLVSDAGVMNGLAASARPGAGIEIRLNAGALAEVGLPLEKGAGQIHSSMSSAGWRMERPNPLDAAALRSFPTTWARRLAYGRDPRAVVLTGQLARQ